MIEPSISWNGFTLRGNARSIAEVRRLLTAEAGCDGLRALIVRSRLVILGCDRRCGTRGNGRHRGLVRAEPTGGGG